MTNKNMQVTRDTRELFSYFYSFIFPFLHNVCIYFRAFPPISFTSFYPHVCLMTLRNSAQLPTWSMHKHIHILGYYECKKTLLEYISTILAANFIIHGILTFLKFSPATFINDNFHYREENTFNVGLKVVFQTVGMEYQNCMWINQSGNNNPFPSIHPFKELSQQ